LFVFLVISITGLHKPEPLGLKFDIRFCTRQADFAKLERVPLNFQSALAQILMRDPFIVKPVAGDFPNERVFTAKVTITEEDINLADSPLI
jgi:hypothetical protein